MWVGGIASKRPKVYAIVAAICAVASIVLAVTIVIPFVIRDDIRLTVKTDKRSYAPGEPVMITVRLTNRAHHPLTLTFNSSAVYRFSVQLSGGAAVFNDYRASLQVITHIQLAPGETWTQGAQWDQVDNTATGNSSGPQVPAGDYDVLVVSKGSQGTLQASASIDINP